MKKSLWNEEPPAYFCDAQKNVTCRKTGCHLSGGPCFLTTKKEYALMGENGPAIYVRKPEGESDNVGASKPEPEA